MEATCPYCSKTIMVSHEEIARRGGAVVCPQCLATYVVRDDGTTTTDLGEIHFSVAGKRCPDCHKILPGAEIAFCPYCGHSLKAPTPEPADKPEEKSEEKPGQDHGHRHRHDSGGPQDFFRPRNAIHLMPSYRVYDTEQEPASLRFRAAAWAVIFALIALLIFIIVEAIPYMTD